MAASNRLRAELELTNKITRRTDAELIRAPALAPQADPLSALRRLADSLRNGDADARWFSSALDKYFEDLTVPLESVLGMKAHRGKKNETPTARAVSAARINAAAIITADIVGVSKKAEILSRIGSGQDRPGTEQGRAVLAELEKRGITFPKSWSGCYSIVRRISEK